MVPPYAAPLAVFHESIVKLVSLKEFKFGSDTLFISCVCV